MDPSRKVWKSIVLSHAALEFDKHEIEAQHQQKLEDLKKLKSDISEAVNENKTSKSEIEAKDKYLESVNSNFSLLKSSKESLLKEKNNLLKQLELSRIKNREDTRERETTLAKYTVMWDQLLSGHEELPLVKKKRALEIRNKKTEIELRTKKKDLEKLQEQVKLYDEINNRRFQQMIVEFAQARVDKKNMMEKHEKIRKQLDRKTEELQQKTNRPKEAHTYTSTVVNTENTLETTDSINNMMVDLHSLSFSSLLSNEGQSLSKFGEAFSIHDLVKTKFLPVCQFSKDSSKIPVLNKTDYKVAAKQSLDQSKNIARNPKKFDQIYDINNSIKPCKIVSPRNSRIPVVESPSHKKCELSAPENPMNPTAASPQASPKRAHVSPSVTSSVICDNFLKPNTPLLKNCALKRKSDSPNLARPRPALKTARNENHPVSSGRKFNTERKNQLNVSNSKIGAVSSITEGIKNFANSSPQKVAKSNEKLIVEYDRNTIVSDPNKIVEKLNETYTVEEEPLIGREERDNRHDEIDQNVEELHAMAADNPQNDQTVSKYFQDDDKENTPPHSAAHNTSYPNADNYEEMPLDMNLQGEGSVGDLNESHGFGDFVASPPFSPSQDKDLPDDGFENFAKETSKVTSSPTTESADDNNSASGGFNLFFKSKPRKTGFNVF